MQTETLLTPDFASVDSNQIKTVKVAIFDVQPVFRLGLITYIKKMPGFSIITETGDWNDFSRDLIRYLPEIIIMDISLEGDSNIELLRNIRYKHQKIPILVLTDFEEMVFAKQVIRAGANGYIMKRSSPDEIINAIKEVFDGKIYVSERVYNILLEEATKQELRDPRCGTDNLSSREFQVFLLIGKGMQPKEITDNLNLTRGTVEYDRKIMMNKLSLKNLKELRDFAISWVRSNKIN
jgi:DNA-binding NarL/FixJ family response regulator